MKNLQFWPESLGAMLEYWYIERGLFVLKIEKLSHIMAPTPILEMARAYGLRPWLWLLLKYNSWIEKPFCWRSNFKNSCFVLHRGFKHSKTIKARGRRPSAFIVFECLKPRWNTRTRFFFRLRQVRESRSCPRNSRARSSEELCTMSKNRLRGITLVREPVWGIHSLTLIISCSVTKKGLTLITLSNSQGQNTKRKSK